MGVERRKYKVITKTLNRSQLEYIKVERGAPNLEDFDPHHSRYYLIYLPSGKRNRQDTEITDRIQKLNIKRVKLMDVQKEIFEHDSKVEESIAAIKRQKGDAWSPEIAKLVIFAVLRL